jgi:S-DNA-T family DNA segregation ATPase FtsK/SpoIIIE
VVQEGVTAPSKLAPVASKVSGAARRLAQQGWWWVTGSASGVPTQRRAVRVSSDPMDSAVAHAIRDVFETSGVMAELTGATVGPRITMYEVRKYKGQSVERVLKLQKELEYAVGSSAIRIISPIPGKSAIGIEVPREKFDPVTLSEIFAGSTQAPHPLLAAIGKDLEGRSVIANLAEMPHLLIAGATGAGKSSCLNGLLVSIIQRATPEQVRMILIDPKRVEFMPYDGLPHLLMPVVTDAKKAVQVLEWLASEMEMRYDQLERARVRNIDEFNKTSDEKMPYILAVVDELADLMMADKKSSDTEDVIVRIAQKARAAGIHLVLATQRPSVDVVTGLIKANMPSRLAFAVASGDDSRTILGGHGAEKLLGKGDGLFVPAGAMVPVRIQSPLVSDSEIASAVQGARSGSPTIEHVVMDCATQTADPQLDRARALVVSSQNGSVSMLQRELGVGFARANEIMDSLESEGIVGPARKGKPRVVLVVKGEGA